MTAGNLAGKAILVTGAARRVGAGIARELHRRGALLILHYRESRHEAESLAAALRLERPGSVALAQGDLLDTPGLPALVERAAGVFGRLDGLVNNASSFFPTGIGAIDEAVWQDLMGSNLKAPLWLAQAAAPFLTEASGAIVGIVDIHAERPMKSHVVYNLAKAGHAQLIRSLALELAPRVRVNGVSPGANIWPESHDVLSAPDARAAIEAGIPLGRIGTPEDIARAVAFLLSAEASYITGQILAVDGGRSIVL
ncbi:pteridine reductase [Paludibacterium paludis]|uniref:Pteridine reductase n=1 Tax=Paludibacterium paludis TaxID=1225769 RepID=A0A918P3K5_9NEIS|nr:pteridine reductase [Paludibacterium paludis]GGY18535.1 pteridine reductase [Paludibacterium paludis]